MRTQLRPGRLALAISLAGALAGCLSKPGAPNNNANGDGGIDASDGGSDAGSCTPAVPLAQVPPIHVTAASIGGGTNHVCLIDTTGQLWCWGDNSHGQLGEHSVATTTGTPEIAQAGSSWTQVAGGAGHTCALESSGDVYCWGASSNGEAGTFQDPSPSKHMAFTGNAEIASIYASSHTTCAIDRDTRLWIWGDTRDGNLENDPAAIAPGGLGSGWTDVAISSDTICALQASGSAYCWGNNGESQAGATAGSSAYTLAAPVTLADKYTSLSGGDSFNCGIATDQSLHCWGENAAQAGGDVTPASDRVLDPGSAFSAVAAGQHHTCVIRAGGDVVCFGDNGDGATGVTFEPHDLDHAPVVMSNALALVAGAAFSCGLDGSGTVKCWGTNVTGELGNGEVATQIAPNRVALPCGEVTDLTVGNEHACAIVGSAGLYCWGLNDTHEISSASDITLPTPTRVGSADYDLVTIQDDLTCARRHAAQNTLDCWGKPSSGDTAKSFTSVGSAWDQLASADHASCGMSSGSAYCWGYAGDPNESTYVDPPRAQTTTVMPAQVGVATSTVALVAASAIYEYGADSACASGSGGSDATSPSAARLVASAGSATFDRVALGVAGAHGCATYAGQLQCWGQNNASQAAPAASGCVAATVVPPPSTVPGTTWSTAVSVGYAHSCAIASTQQLYCWGNTDNFVLGVHAQGPAAVRHPTLAVDGTWSDVETAATETCAIAADRRSVSCWGLNEYGTAGNGFAFHPDAQRVNAP